MRPSRPPWWSARARWKSTSTASSPSSACRPPTVTTGGSLLSCTTWKAADTVTTSLLMTPARRITLALGVPAALIAIGWTAFVAVAWAGQGSYPVHYSVPVRGGQVSVSVSAGRVSVRPGTAGRVTVNGTVHYSLVRPKVTVRSTGSGVAVGSGCHAFVVSCSDDFAVTVPAGLGTDISVGSGDLSAAGLSGAVTLSAQSGNMRAAGL